MDRIGWSTYVCSVAMMNSGCSLWLIFARNRPCVLGLSFLKIEGSCFGLSLIEVFMLCFVVGAGLLVLRLAAEEGTPHVA